MKIVQSIKNLFYKAHPYSVLESQIHYRFKHLDYLEQAFTHRSVDSRPRKNYERLEFLGDAIIDIVVSTALMKEFPESDEGFLTQKRSALVQKDFLSSMGKLLRLLDYIKLESSVDIRIEKIAVKQQANLYEALIGAIYLDGGLAPCEKLIHNTIWSHRTEAWKSTNYKGRLIELCHFRKLKNPQFKLCQTTGLDHQRIFEVQVQIGEKVYNPGLGTSKKDAEQSAAQHALDSLMRSEMP